MDDIQRFITGFRVFQKDYFGSHSAHFEPLKNGQSPKTMIIGCSDSRVDPALLTNSAPGDIFMVRNVANLVPPYETDDSLHGVSAALEFAVCILEVEHIIVLGHSQCGGIKTLMQGNCEAHGGTFISRWMSIAAPARDRIRAELAEKDADHQQYAAGQAAILLSIENLRSFPFINERVSQGSLSLHGWYFDLREGELLEYRADEGAFTAIGRNQHAPGPLGRRE